MNVTVETPQDLFDPRHYAHVRKATPVARTLPPWCYTSREFYERERDRIFFRYWNCVGHESLVPEAGSYFALRFMEVPLLIVRGEDLKLRAFINACSHRFAEVATGSGSCKFLKCPYHAWAFSLTGELIGTPLFDESDVFKKSDHGLKEIKLDTWAGLIWISFNDNGADLRSHLGDLPSRTAPWKTEDMLCVSRVSRTVMANWKHYFENFSDSYHVPFVHKTSLDFSPVRGRELHDPAIYKGNYIMHAAWFDGTRGVRIDEKAFPEIPLPPELRGSFYPWVYPNAGMGFSNDMVWVVEVYPEGPSSFTHVRSLLVPRQNTELSDFAEILENYVRNQDIVTKEDVAILEAQQRACRSPFFQTGRFARMDRLVHDCQMWILDHVLANESATTVGQSAVIHETMA